MEYVFIMAAIINGIFMPPKEMASAEECVEVGQHVGQLYTQRGVKAEIMCFRFTDKQGWVMRTDGEWEEIIPNGGVDG